jgi:hypothetical protein
MADPSPNPDSILDSIKKTLGLDPSYEVFDLDVIMHINTAFSVLRDLGVGSPDGFSIEDSTAKWSSYSGDMVRLAAVKSYVSAKVRLLFDPPATSFAIAAMERQVAEMEWRLNVIGETISPPSDPKGLPVTPVYSKVVQLVYAPDVTPDAMLGNFFYLTLAGDCKVNAPINGRDGEHISLEITSNGHVATWGSEWDFGDAGVPVLSGAGRADIISAYYKRSLNVWRAGFTSGF